MFERGVWMDPDMNKYDLVHVTAEHPLMSERQWRDVYNAAWKTYYSPEHIKTLLRRARADGIPLSRVMRGTRDFYACYTQEGVHPLDGGLLRRKYRRDRRPGHGIEPPILFHIRFFVESLMKYGRVAKLAWDFNRLKKEVERDPHGDRYTDIAISPASDSELDALDMFTSTAAARSTVEHARRRSAVAV